MSVQQARPACVHAVSAELLNVHAALQMIATVFEQAKNYLQAHLFYWLNIPGQLECHR